MNIHKQTIKQIVTLFSIGILMAALCILLYRFDNKYTYPGDTGLNGVAILGEDSLRACPAVFLARGWEFYQYKLLSPEDFETAPPIPDTYLYIGQYSGFNLGDRMAEPHGSATYRIRVSLPEEPRSYALELPEIYSSCRVYVNGVLLAQRGNPDPEMYRPETKTGIITFWAGGQAEIIIAASDFTHFYSGLVYPPAFGLPEAVSAVVGKKLIMRAVFCFAALLTGAAFIAAGVLQKNKLTTAYGFTCLFFMGYTCYPLVHAVGWSGPMLWYDIENLCYCLTFLMALYLQSKLCDIPVIIFRFIVAYGVVMCLPTVFSEQFKQSLDGMILYSRLIDTHKLIVFVYLSWVAVYAAVKKTMTSQLQILGVTAFGVSLLMDRLLPVFEPIYIGWFPELGGSALVACLGADICVKAARMRNEVLALHGQMDLMEERADHAESQILLQRNRLESLRAEIDETRRNKHDLRHHIFLLRELLYSDPERARAYWGELDASQPGTEDSLCKNLIVDCIVRQYTAAARQEGITVETAIDISEDPGVSDLDLCIIFSNLLENALEALRGEAVGESRILRITAGITGKMLAINVDNSLCKPLRYRRGVLMSSKRDAIGVGLSSIRAVADKYGGEFEWRTIDGMFRASVVLIIENREVMRYEDSRV